METSTSTTDLPSLVESDDELWTDYFGDYISVWLRNSATFIQDQKQKMLQLALSPFLLGVTHNLPQAWNDVLHTSGLLAKDRENKTTPLSEVELDIVEMAEMIFTRCSQLVGNKNDLKTILNFIYDVDHRSLGTEKLDISYGLQEVVGLEVFSSMWAPIKRIYEKRKRQAHICIIYYFKIISQEIIFYGQGSGDKSDFIKRGSELRKTARSDRKVHIRDGSDLFTKRKSKPKKVVTDHSESESVTLKDSYQALIEGDYQLAVDRYSTLIEQEPFNSVLYSNRSQAYLYLSDYRSALCDCKRATILDPKNSLNYLRAAKCYIELGQLDKAEDANNQSLMCCTEPTTKEEIHQQRQDIQARSVMTKISHSINSSASEERDLDNAEVQYRRMMLEGCHCYLTKVFHKAADYFKSALDLLSRPGNEGLIAEEEQLVMWFAYGMSCVKTANNRNIQYAVEKFQTMLSGSQPFPAAYLGLGLAYMASKRFKAAELVLKEGLEKVKQYEGKKLYMWPHTNKVFEEASMPNIKKQMKELLKECMHPPKPDAICKYHSDVENSRKEIYVSDPDYKGHITIKCRANCCIEFHTQCWKHSDTNNKGKYNWKDMLDLACPTPGCWGSISEVYISRPDQDKSIKLSSQTEMKQKVNPPRPKQKMKMESQDKLERKLEKKRLRKERRSEARQQNLELAVDEEDPDQHKVLNAYQQLPDVDMANIDRTGGTLLRKDDQDFLCEHKKQKANKAKKKEKKQKHFLTLDVQFRGDENKQRFGVNSLDEDGDFYKLPPAFLNPGLLPLPEQQPVAGPSPVANTAPPAQKSTVDTENLDLSLYEYFYKILLAKGPIHLHSEEMQEHINSLSEEDQTRLLFHGGLPCFLSADPRFSISQNHLVSAVIPGQSNVSHRTPQVNPWEVKSNKAATTAGPLPLKFPFPSLNPSAKEFVPSETSSTSLASDVGMKEADKPTISYARMLNSELSEHPSVLAENSEEDDGFTTVVNKKRVHTYLPPQQNVAPSVIIKNTPKLSSNYDALDQITLDLPGSKQGHTSEISFDPSRSESQNLRKPQRIAMDLDPITLDSPIYRRIHEESETAYKKSSDIDLQYGRTQSPDLFQDKSSANQYIKTSAPLLARTSNILGQPGHISVSAVDSPREDLQRVLSPALSTNSGSSSGSHPPGQQPTSLRPLKAPSITLPTRGRKKKPLGHLSKLHGQPASGDGIQSFDGYDLESVSSTTSDKDSISEDIRFSLADRGHPLAAGSMSQLDSSRLPSVFVPTSGIQDFTQGVGVCFEKAHSSFDGFKSSLPSRTLISPERSDSAGRSRNEMFATKKDVWSTGASEGRHSQDFSLSKNPSSSEAEFESLTAHSRSLSSSPFVQPQNPIRRPQAQSRILSQMAASPTHHEKLVAPPSYWDYDPTRVSQEDLVTNPPSDPWKDQEKWNRTASSLFQTDLHSFSPFLSEPSEVSAASVDHAAPPKKATVWDYQHVLNSNSPHQEAAKEASKQFPDPWLDPWVPDPLHLPTAHHDSDKPPHLNLFPSAVKSPKEKLLDPRIVLPDLFHHSQTSNRSSVYASKSLKQDERWSPLSGEDKFRSSSSPVSDLAGDKVKPLLLFSQWADVPNSPASSETPHQPSSSLPEQSKLNVESNIMSWMNNVGTSQMAETFRQVNKDHLSSDQIKVPLASRHSKNSADLLSDKSCKMVQTDLNGAEIEDIMIKVKEELRQKDITTKENVRLNDLVKSYEVQLDHERSLSYQLKKDLKKLSGQFKVAEMSAEKWREDYQGLAGETEILKEDKQFLADEIVMLNRRLDTERMKVLSSQLEVLDLKTLVMVHRVDMKEQEANYHLQRLASVISQAQTVAKNLPDSVYEKHKEFTSYIKSCEAVRRQIEMIALRLKEHLKQGLTIDMTDLEFHPPTFPKPPNELIDRPQNSISSDHLVPQSFTSTDHLVDYRNGSHSNIFNSNDSRTRVSSSTPKKVMRMEEDEEDDDSKAYLSMFYSAASSNSFVSVASNESLTETTKPLGSSSLHSARSKPASDTAFYSNGSLSSMDHRPMSPARQVKPPVGSSFHSVPWSHQGSSAKQQAHAAKTRSEQNLLTKSGGHHVGNNVQLRDDMPSFDRIVTAVQDTFPSSSRIEIQNILDNLRRNKGSLLGWGSEALTREVLKTMKQTQTLEAAEKTEAPDQQSTSGSVSDSLDFMCSICQSEIEPLESTVLTCGHRFHESCIERWLHSDRTCPNCRSHTLLSQEFPSLK